MNFQLPIIVCMAVLSALMTETINSDVSNDAPSNSAEDLEKLQELRDKFVSREGFLFGERTPVWLAQNPNNGTPVVHTRLRLDMMKQAMIMWRSHGGKSIKLDPSIDGYSRLDKENDNEVPSVPVDVIHLSILFVMDFGENLTELHGPHKHLDTVESMLVYAIAFWNSVDIQMKFLQPKVRIRIAGIVIGNDRESTPYIYDNVSPSGYYDAESAIISMQKYWDTVSNTPHTDFPKKAYDCVVTLTQLPTRDPIKYDFNLLADRLVEEDSFKVLSIIINGGRAFIGVAPLAKDLTEMLIELPISNRQKNALRELGAKKSSKPYLQFQYFSSNGQPFFEGFKKPKEFHNPGKPLEIILPAQMFAGPMQCRDSNPDFKIVCPTAMSCEDLKCSGPDITCKSIGRPPVDGSGCPGDKVCLAGKCVKKEVFELH